MYRVNSLGAEWSHDHIDYPHHSLLYVEYVDQCVTFTPSSFVSPESASLVSGVEKINLKPEESIDSLLLPPGLVGGLRGRNPLLVVSSVTPGDLFPN